MKNLIVSTFFVFISLSLAAQSSEEKAVRSELEEANRTLEKAIEDQDPEVFSLIFAEDAIFKVSGYDALEGRDAIVAAHRPLMEQGMKLNLETDEIIYFGDYAHMIGDYTLVAPNGQLADKGSYSTLWKKVNGKWQIYRDMTSNVNPQQ